MEPANPSNDGAAIVESDDRFPTGPWTGFFLQPGTPERHWMELSLIFREGIMAGTGRDRVGRFTVSGRYYLDSGRAHWTKTYVAEHSIAYSGYNEGKGIWGVWEYQSNWRGGFHIWPEAMGDPTQLKLAEAVKAPTEAQAEIPTPAPPEESAPAEVDAPTEREPAPVGATLI